MSETTPWNDTNEDGPGPYGEQPEGRTQTEFIADDIRHICIHGPRRWVTGQNARGEWAGWFCAAPKAADKSGHCATQWIR